MPVRDGQHVCCFCGQRHFYTSGQVTIMHGCYRSVLKQLSDFKWLAESPPAICHSLLMRHAEVDTFAVKRLGRLSRVLSEAMAVNKWSGEQLMDEPLCGSVLLKAHSRIQVRAGLK
eukprot:2918800-Amphidinium_carterae.1